MENSRSIEINLCEFWGIEELQFTSQFAINKNGIGYFRNVRLQDGSRCFFPDQTQVTISVPPELKFDENYDYKVNAYVAPLAKRKQLNKEYVLFLDKQIPPKILEIEPKDYIAKLRYEYTSAKGIAKDALIGSLKRLSSETNKKPETFIFELLQNADDNYDPIKKKVNVRFLITENHLILVHNGQPFNQKNVYGICGVASGDKEFEFNKTGYKGIGFKSVFKHSNYVWIHSGGFSFRFDEMYHRGKGYETFWQVLPIWTNAEDVDFELRTPQILQAPVSFVFRPYEGKKRLLEIEKVFLSVFGDEKVLLFLRSVESISFSGLEHSFTKQKLPKNWEISSLPLVAVSESIREHLNETIDKRLDERVPEKFKDIFESEIKFATRKVENKIATTEDGKLYAYLPTSLNFGFPFLINGDFIPDGSRDKLFWDIKWNQFLFEQSGYQFVCWIRSLYERYADSCVYDLIPDFDELITNESDKDKKLYLDLFYKGFLDGIKNIPIFADTDNNLRFPDELLIDKTGFCEQYPKEFIKLIGINKLLIHSSLNDKNNVIRIIETRGTVFNKKSLIELCDKADFKSWLRVFENNIAFLKFLGQKKWLGDLSDKTFMLSAMLELKCPKNLYNSLSDDYEYIDWLQVETVHPQVYGTCKHLELPVIKYEPVSFITDYIKQNSRSIDDLIEDKSNNLKFYRYIFKYRSILPDDLFTKNNIGYFKVWGHDEDTIGSLSNDKIYLFNDNLVQLIKAGVFPNNHIKVLTSEFPESHDDVQQWSAFWKRFGVLDPAINNYFDFVSDEILDKINPINKHFRIFEDFDDKPPTEEYLKKHNANSKLWVFICGLINKLSQEQLNKLKDKLGRLIVFTTKSGETDHAEDCYLSKDYTDNGTLETLTATFDEINLSFISDIYLKNGTFSKTDWRNLFTKYASAKTNEKEFAEVVLREINNIAKANLVEAVKFIYKYMDTLTDKSGLSNIPIKTISDEFVKSNRAIISDHYLNTAFFGTILPSVKIDSLVSEEYSDKCSEGWVSFFKEIGLQVYLQERDVIDLKITLLINNELVTTDNAIVIVAELARLDKNGKLDDALIEKLKELPLMLKGRGNEMQQAVNCRLPSLFNPKIDLEKLVSNHESIYFISETYLEDKALNLDVLNFLTKIVTSSFCLIHEKNLPWSKAPEFYKKFIENQFKETFRITNAFHLFITWTSLTDIELIVENTALRDVFWKLFLDKDQWLNTYYQEELFFAQNSMKYCSNKTVSWNNKVTYYTQVQNVYNLIDYLLSFRANTPTLSGDFKPAIELYSFKLANLIDDRSLVCSKEVSQIINNNTNESLEQILGIKQTLSLDLCLKRINKLRNWELLEKEGIWSEVFASFSNNESQLTAVENIALAEFSQYGFLPNQLGHWVSVSELYYVADDFKLGVGNSKWLIKNALKKFAQKFGASPLTKKDFKPEYKDESIEPDLTIAFEKRLKYIAFAQDQQNWKELEITLSKNLSVYNFLRVSRIAYTYAEVDPPITNAEFNFYHSGQNVYYVGQWNGTRANKLIDFIHEASQSNISLKLFQDLLLNSEEEIISYFDDRNIGVLNEWLPLKPKHYDQESIITKNNVNPFITKPATSSINEIELIRKQSESVGLPAPERKNVNTEAKKVASLWLEAQGFDLDKAEETFDQINNVYHPSSNSLFKVLVSSISGGILYIRPVKWIELGAENTFLLTVDGAGNIRRFDTQEELLHAHKRTLFRFTNKLVDSDMIDEIAEVNSEIPEAQFLFYDSVSHFDEYFSMSTVTRRKPDQNILDINPEELNEIDLNQ